MKKIILGLVHLVLVSGWLAFGSFVLATAVTEPELRGVSGWAGGTSLAILLWASAFRKGPVNKLVFSIATINAWLLILVSERSHTKGLPFAAEVLIFTLVASYTLWSYWRRGVLSFDIR